MREYIPKKISRGAWRRITSVIYDYCELTGEFSRAEKLKDVPEVYKKELKRKLDAYKKVWDESSEETKNIIEKKFRKHLTYEQIDLPMSLSTKKRIAADFIHRLGQELGEIK